MAIVVNGFGTPPGREVGDTAAVVEVWSILVDDEEVARRGLPLIPAAERRRLSLLAPPHRHRHICAHLAARVLASVVLGAGPPAQALTRTPSGRLVLTAPDSRLDISLAHAGASAAIAISRGAAVGVDLEPISPLVEVEEQRLARYSLAESEWTYWIRAAPQLRTQLLTRAWTRKEAVLKALGLGLSGDVRSVVTELGPNSVLAPEPGWRPSEIRGLPAAAGDPSTWTLQDLPDEPGLIGSVAVRSANVELRHHRYAIADLLTRAGEISAAVSASVRVVGLPS